MPSSSTVVSLRQPDEVEDPSTAVLRSGARRLLAQAIEAEAETFLATMKDLRLPDGRDRVVRHGLGPERRSRPGSARSGCGASSCATAAPWRAGAFASPRPSCRGGPGARGAWMGCCRSSTCAGSRWATSGRRSGRCWARRPEPVAVGDRTAAGRMGGGLCALAAARPVGPALRLCLGRRRLPAGAHGAAGRVHAGADRRDARGQEGAPGLPGRYAREHAELAGAAGRPEGRGLAVTPELATGDGALGFWKALEEVSPTTRHQRCTVHKTANVLDKLPKSVQPRPRPTCARSGRPRTARRQRLRLRRSPRSMGPSTRRRSPAWSRIATRC